jgi:hypothetical protein
MPNRLLSALVTPSASPSGDVLDVTATGRTLKILAVAAIVFLFTLAIASTVRRGKDGID